MFTITAIVGVIVGLGQLVKGLDLFPAKYLPLLSLVLGVLAGVFVMDYPSLSLAEHIFLGAMLGLSASGLYDQAKIAKPKGDKPPIGK